MRYRDDNTMTSTSDERPRAYEGSPLSHACYTVSRLGTHGRGQQTTNWTL
jgi:hypothetical protein